MFHVQIIMVNRQFHRMPSVLRTIGAAETFVSPKRSNATYHSIELSVSEKKKKQVPPLAETMQLANPSNVLLWQRATRIMCCES